MDELHILHPQLAQLKNPLAQAIAQNFYYTLPLSSEDQFSNQF